MLRLVTSDAFVLSANAFAVVCLIVFPALIAAYAFCQARVRQIGLDFSLGKLESTELDRAVLLYRRVSERQQEIQRECAQVTGSLLARYQHRRSLRRQFAEERDQLGAYAVHLRSAIIGLRRRPIRRFEGWARAVSTYFAVSCALVVYLGTWAALIAIYQPDHPTWQNLLDDLEVLLPWMPVDFHLLYGNLLASSLAVVAMPMFYFGRRLALRRSHDVQLRDLREFADIDPDVLITRIRANEESVDENEPTCQPYEVLPLLPEQPAWFEILGVSPSATAEEVKQAYKALVKQNHPDRVHGMSPAFRELAERETRKLNIAYEEAIASLRQPIAWSASEPAHG